MRWFYSSDGMERYSAIEVGAQSCDREWTNIYYRKSVKFCCKKYGHNSGNKSDTITLQNKSSPSPYKTGLRSWTQGEGNTRSTHCEQVIKHIFTGQGLQAIFPKMITSKFVLRGPMVKLRDSSKPGKSKEGLSDRTVFERYSAGC